MCVWRLFDPDATSNTQYLRYSFEYKERTNMNIQIYIFD